MTPSGIEPATFRLVAPPRTPIKKDERREKERGGKNIDDF
jgi:hypothetical protein